MALKRYDALAVASKLPGDCSIAAHALDALARLTKQAGRPRKTQDGIEWDDDPELRVSIKAIVRRRDLAEPESVTEALAAVETRAAAALGRSLTRAQRDKLSHLLRRPKVEAREIYEQIMSWRTSLTTRQIRKLRGFESFHSR